MKQRQTKSLCAFNEDAASLVDVTVKQRRYWLDPHMLRQVMAVAREFYIAATRLAPRERGASAGTRATNGRYYCFLTVAVRRCDKHGPRIDDNPVTRKTQVRHFAQQNVDIHCASGSQGQARFGVDHAGRDLAKSKRALLEGHRVP